MVVPSSDGAIVLERHIKHDNGKLVAFEYWSLRYTPDGVNDTVVNWVVPTRYWTSGSMRAN